MGEGGAESARHKLQRRSKISAKEEENLIDEI
jgi:hypothetical protein